MSIWFDHGDCSDQHLKLQKLRLPRNMHVFQFSIMNLLLFKSSLIDFSFCVSFLSFLWLSVGSISLTVTELPDGVHGVDAAGTFSLVRYNLKKCIFIFLYTLIHLHKKAVFRYHQETYATESTAHTFDPVFNRKLLAKENCPEYGSAELVGRSLRLLNNTDQEDEQVGIVDEEVLHTMNAEIGNLKNSIHEMLRQMGQFEQSLAWALHKINHDDSGLDICIHNVLNCRSKGEMLPGLGLEGLHWRCGVVAQGYIGKDKDTYNNQVHLVNALVRNHFIKYNFVSLCDNDNLATRGKPIDRFIKDDGFHLTDQGVARLASNIKRSCEEILNCQPSTKSSKKPYNYNNQRYGYYYGDYWGDRWG
ncbi:unnamed protein product [Mytilus coruscus]|uniref:Uncharacterized protein n=1 Tax=Mytilus coruscus TaxID=42192 RepID=A0A6J8BVC0_MYTCO|nr:unnamed protein product [Mytilus coruscus]